MLRLVDVTDEGAWIRKRIASADMPEQSAAGDRGAAGDAG